MTPSEIQATSTNPAAAAAPAMAAHGHGFSFHELLSAMNPLQYLPVVGTIYRAVTGDVIPEALRDGGSMLVSGLLGGPIGLITYIATTIAEKITGIDPEKIVAAVLKPAPPAVAAIVAPAGMPTADPAPAQITPTQITPTPVTPTPVTPAKITPAPITPPPIAPTPTQFALTPQQLAAYGVSSEASGTLKLGDVQGADVLNIVELALLRGAAAAYAANQPPPIRVAAPAG
jgi:hypothetical protein